jgi:signal transduction histidine kinase
MNATQETLFVVDDDTASRNAVAALAASMKMRCELFGSAEEFLDRYDPSWTGCALIDWHLKGMDGLQLQERLRALSSSLGVVMVSAYADVPMAVYAMKNGALGVLEKPYQCDDLADLLHEATSRGACAPSPLGESGDERDRLLVCDLHDGVAQYLAMAIMLLDECKPSPDDRGERPLVLFQDAMRLLKRTMRELRNLIRGTHLATDAKDVEGVLAELVSEFHDRLEIELVHEPSTAHLEVKSACAFYCVVHELLSNAWLHSGSRKVRIGVERSDGKLRVEVKDWGTGFDPAGVERGRFGLQGIRNRAQLFGGQVAVESAPGQGTAVSVCLPLVVPRHGDSEAAVPRAVALRSRKRRTPH